MKSRGSWSQVRTCRYHLASCRVYIGPVTRLRPLSALLLLAAFAVGGLAAPFAHEVGHAGEAQDALAHRSDADHHHHDALDDHGLEVLPPCPDAFDADLACVLCAAPSAVVAHCENGLAVQQPIATNGRHVPGASASPLHAALGPRGPPALV